MHLYCIPAATAEQEITEDEPQVEDEMIKDDEGGYFVLVVRLFFHVKNCYPEELRSRKNENQKNIIFVFANKLGTRLCSEISLFEPS